MSVFTSLVGIMRGAACAIRDPRRLATLAIESASARAEGFEREAKAALGGLPRCVPFDAFLNTDGDCLPAFTFLDDTSTVIDLLLLRALVRRYDARTMLEIGTFRGESALAVATAGADVVTLSLADDALLEQGAQRSWVEAHRTLSTGHPRITHIFGDSAALDTRPYREWADILFIDGDHSRHAVEADTRRFWVARSCRTGAVVWHDAFFSPLVPRWEVLAGIAAGVPATHRSHLVQVSNTLCLAWLPDADALPTVDRSYVPQSVYSVGVTPVAGWRSQKADAVTVQTGAAPRHPVPEDAKGAARERA
jgi:predicted O-methyltransferase YrrM